MLVPKPKGDPLAFRPEDSLCEALRKSRFAEGERAKIEKKVLGRMEGKPIVKGPPTYNSLGKGACTDSDGNGMSSYFAQGEKLSASSCKDLCSKYEDCVAYSWSGSESMCALNVSKKLVDSPAGYEFFDQTTDGATDIAKADGDASFECFKKVAAPADQSAMAQAAVGQPTAVQSTTAQPAAAFLARESERVHAQVATPVPGAMSPAAAAAAAASTAAPTAFIEQEPESPAMRAEEWYNEELALSSDLQKRNENLHRLWDLRAMRTMAEEALDYEKFYKTWS